MSTAHDYPDPDSDPTRHDYLDPEAEQGISSEDPYSVTPEVNPEVSEQPFERTLSDKTEDEARAEIRIDGEAYNDLTKPDPNFATWFDHTEVRGEYWLADYLKRDKESYFRMLGGIHRGEKNGPKWEHSALHTHSLREDLVEIIGRKLNLQRLQLEEAKAWATNVDGEKFGMSLELLVYCVCAYVVHNDNLTPYARQRKVHPNCKTKDVIFEQVAFELDLHPKRINRVYRRFEQTFSKMPTPPKGFDPRKPGWKPGCTEGVNPKPARDFSTRAGKWPLGLSPDDVA